jgi:hypothetical protein
MVWLVAGTGNPKRKRGDGVPSLTFGVTEMVWLVAGIR